MRRIVFAAVSLMMTLGIALAQAPDAPARRTTPRQLRR